VMGVTVGFACRDDVTLGRHGPASTLTE
jgi:hypothetical protein